MFLEMFSLRSLEVEPRVCEGLHMWQQSLDEGMEFVLQKENIEENQKYFVL